MFSFQPISIQLKDLSGSRNFHSSFCFLSVILGTPCLRESQWPLPALCALPTPAHQGMWRRCQGASSAGVMFLVELKWSTTAATDTILCSQLMLLIIQFQGQPGTLRFVSRDAWYLDMMPSSVPNFASKRNEALPASNWASSWGVGGDIITKIT